MKTYLDCIPCIVRQSLASVRRVTDDARIQEQVLREVLQATSRMNMNQPPAAMAQIVHRRIRQLCGNEDPYRESKEHFNRLAQELLPAFERHLKDAADPWEMAIRLAIAGNVMDLGVKSGLNEAQIRVSIGQSLDEPLVGSPAHFATAIAEAKSILYLTDNAGEIVFDRLLIERMPREKLTVAVRGAPIINDATREDAETAGLTQMVRVIDNGSDAPGTILSDCNQAFQQQFAAADLIVAKGQGNYETLRGCSKRICFLLRVKCSVIAQDIGCPVGRMVLQSSNGRPVSVSKGADSWQTASQRVPKVK